MSIAPELVSVLVSAAGTAIAVFAMLAARRWRGDAEAQLKATESLDALDRQINVLRGRVLKMSDADATRLRSEARGAEEVLRQLVAAFPDPDETKSEEDATK